MALLILDSVATAIDDKTNLTFPLNADDTIDFENEVHLDDCCDEWFSALSQADAEVVWMI